MPKFITKKWIENHDQSDCAKNRYKPSKQIRFKAFMVRSDLCDYSDAYIVAKGDIITEGRTKKDIKNNSSFVNWISKINNVLTDNAENLDVVMSMYNLI